MSLDEKEQALFATWERISARRGMESLDGPHHSERVFAAIWNLEAELNNGGFSQWMFNVSGDDAELAAESLREIGAEQAANVCERFFAMLPGGKPMRDQEARQAQLETAASALGEDAFESACQTLEREFYALEDDLRDRLLAFSRARALDDSATTVT